MADALDLVANGNLQVVSDNINKNGDHDDGVNEDQQQDASMNGMQQQEAHDTILENHGDRHDKIDSALKTNNIDEGVDYIQGEIKEELIYTEPDNNNVFEPSQLLE